MLETVLKAIDDLLSIIDRYKIKNVHPQVEDLKYLKKSLNTNDELSTREKFTLYQELFPPRGGLSDIHYWHNDFGTRKTVNEVISDSTKTIADICWNGNK
ncbi:ABC transporter [Streptococcus sanguinis]|uniref:ABC transporter n=1 Tax=Streptococcus sanguinis TaxID=1305 RepID=A0A7Y0YRV5_STRSA|nr:ABC transporter [Streptococcus sanguinis]